MNDTNANVNFYYKHSNKLKKMNDFGIIHFFHCSNSLLLETIFLNRYLDLKDPIIAILIIF